MAVGINDLIDALTSHASRLGCFDIVQGHEPKSMPGGSGDATGLTYAVFLAEIGPARNASGLVSTTARVVLNGRIYKAFRSEPEDLIDPALADACDRLFEAYTGDFDLGSHARNIDVLGGQGNALSARAGYQSVDGATFRIIDIIVPIVVNDAWNQEA